MLTFVESRLRFEFGEGWEVQKYDESDAYERIKEAVEETKGVDFVGIYQNELYLIEVKNFRNYRLDNQNRFTTGELLIEVAQKFRDTIVGVIAFARQSNSGELEFWDRCAQMIRNRQHVVKVILWLERDLPTSQSQQKRIRASVNTKVLKSKMRWLTYYGLVVDTTIEILPNVRATFLPDS